MPFLLAEHARYNSARSMRAVKGTLATPPGKDNTRSASAAERGRDGA